MDNINALTLIRAEIDRINAKMVDLFLQRTRLSEKIADAKARNNLAVTDAERERTVIETAVANVPEEFKDDVAAFMRALIELSKQRQLRRLAGSRE